MLACPRCGGRMRVIATIEDPRVLHRILTHLGLPTEVPQPRPPPAPAADFFFDRPAARGRVRTPRPSSAFPLTPSSSAL